MQILPAQWPTGRIFDFIRPAVLTLGWQQTWNLFAPVVRTDNMNVVAAVSYRDGSEALYEFPRLEKAPPMEAFLRHKLIKQLIDNMFNGIDEPMWRHTASFIARAKWNSANPPVLVILAQQKAEIPDFEHFANVSDLPQHYKRVPFYFYQVPAGEGNGEVAP